MPPSDHEIRVACDMMQALITAPLPAPKQRQEMFQQVYRTLRKMLPAQAAGEVQDKQKAGDASDLMADPLLSSILDFAE